VVPEDSSLKVRSLLLEIEPKDTYIITWSPYERSQEEQLASLGSGA